MNKLTLQQIECFLEVCRDFNFTRAAARLHMAQPPLSRHIRQLEASIGAILFERTSRRVQLTEAGHAFLEHVCTLPHTLQKAVSASQEAASGGRPEIRIGVVSAILNDPLFAVLQEFRERHESISFDLKEGNPHELLKDLERENLDGAFLGVELPNLPDPLQQYHWRSEPLLACFPKDHKFSKNSDLNIRELKSENLISLHPQVAPAYNAFIEKLFSRFSIEVATVRTAQSIASMISLVISGAGFGLLPSSALGSAGNHLTTIPIQQKSAIIREVFVYRSSKAELLKQLLQLLENHTD